MAVPIYSPHQTFYVPEYDVRVGAGPGVPKHEVRDIIEVRFDDRTNGIDSFEITLNNWDAQQQRFKYEPAISKENEGLFEPEHRLDLRMGYAGNLRVMTAGVITTVEPTYPESGGPTLSIRGQNILHKFRRREFTKTWKYEKDSNVALELGKPPAGDDQPGLNIRVKVNDAALSEEFAEQIAMHNQTEIDFLLDRACRRGYVFYLRQDQQGEFLYFGPADEAARIEYALKWGESLTSFRPTMSTAHHQAASITVRGYDRELGQRVAATKTFPKDCKLNLDLPTRLDGHQVITTPPARSMKEAQTRALEALCNHRREIVTATGATVGLPDLRAGSYIRIDGFSKRFNGRYFVTSTTHAIGSGGYTTNFSARREDLGS